MKKVFSRITSTKMFALVVLSLLVGVGVTQAVLIQTTGGPPTVNVVSLAKDSCGVECTGVKVTWSATAPKGTTITGFTVGITPPANCPGCGNPVLPKDFPATATSGTVGVTTAGDLPAGTYTATVTAKYTSSASASKGQAF